MLDTVHMELPHKYVFHKESFSHNGLKQKLAKDLLHSFHKLDTCTPRMNYLTFFQLYAQECLQISFFCGSHVHNNLFEALKLTKSKVQ